MQLLSSILTVNSSPFGSEEYLGIPHLDAERPVYEKLMDLIIALVEFHNNAE